MPYLLPFEKPLQQIEDRIDALRAASASAGIASTPPELTALQAELDAARKKVFSALTPWEKILLARHPLRPYARDFINRIVDDFFELRGDRHFADDPSIVGGIGWIDGRRVMVIGTQKGRDTRSNLLCHFGCPYPEGYRKALRLMQLAAKFRLPILTLIDTPGAFPGTEGEERHVAEAIAVNLREMFTFPVPIVSVVIGEGGSGGALALGVANRILLLEYAYYSVISPEGCAAILWKDRAHAPEAAEALKLTAPDLLRLGIADALVVEPPGGAHRDYDLAADSLRRAVTAQFQALAPLTEIELLSDRYRKFRSLGRYLDPSAVPAAPV